MITFPGFSKELINSFAVFHSGDWVRIQYNDQMNQLLKQKAKDGKLLGLKEKKRISSERGLGP